ncbi:alpha/beta hydrolase [Shinella sp. CPCC 100929]|uniref:Alpha/beta hydrolase n=2 Tax=Shinella lacus TaxID=2654216 RepID=A0ABT1R1I0_9HYPH|nr:alpha/beta hydrolase [Shinella lacus]
MVKDRRVIMNPSDAAGIGLVFDRFAPDGDARLVGGESGREHSALSIHYVGTAGWKDQSSGCVLLHGGSGDWRHFGANLDRLGERLAIVAPDLPGFGASDLPTGENLAAIADPIAGFVKALPWREITLVGFSFGALVAAAVAVKCRPARLMLISPAGFGAHTPEMADAREAAATAAKANGLRAGLAVNLGRIMLHRSPFLEDEPVLAMMEAMLRANRINVRRFSRREMIVDYLRLVDCPVRVLFGAFDPYHASVLPQRYAAIADACPGAEVTTVPNAAHWLMLETPGAFENALLQFCQKEVRDDDRLRPS